MMSSIHLHNGDTQRDLLARLLAFIQARTWDEAQHLVETQPDLLSGEADTLLEVAATQVDAESRMAIEQHRTLLAQCRTVGIAAAFAALHSDQEYESVFAQQLNAICQHTINVLRDGDSQKQAELAYRIEALNPDDLPRAEVQYFLALLVAWLRDADVAEQATRLPPDLYAAYQRMVSLIAGDESA